MSIIVDGHSRTVVAIGRVQVHPAVRCACVGVPVAVRADPWLEHKPATRVFAIAGSAAVYVSKILRGI